jgi:Phosphotransferase enzyme family
VSAVTESTSARWATSTWRDEAYGWIERILRERGLSRTGEIEQPRVRFWSTQLTVPTDAGRLWFKENCPSQAYEARLVALLAEVVPDHVVEPLAVEPDRGWLLTPDAGETLRRIPRDRPDIDRIELWVRLAANWADLQRRVSPYADRLVATGMPVVAPSELPSLVAERIEEYAALPSDDAGQLATDSARRLRAALPTLTAWAEQVDAAGLPLTLDHNDLHDANAFAPRAGEEHLRFFDFGDSVVGHPFGSLLIALNVLAGEREAELDDPEVIRVVDAYLEVWSDLADPATLRAAVDPARQLARMHRSECWRRVLRSADDAERAEWGDAPTAWMVTLLDHPTFST